jgi:hypothetical protein
MNIFNNIPINSKKDLTKNAVVKVESIFIEIIETIISKLIFKN